MPSNPVWSGNIQEIYFWYERQLIILTGLLIARYDDLDIFSWSPIKNYFL